MSASPFLFGAQECPIHYGNYGEAMFDLFILILNWLRWKYKKLLLQKHDFLVRLQKSAIK